VNEAAIEGWKADTTTFDRVRHVSDVTTEPQAVSTIAERAHVSEPTARKYLSILAESGRVKVINTDSGTRYMRAPQMLAMKRIAAIHREHTKNEIRDSIRDLKTELNNFREQYDVADVDELTLELEPGDDGGKISPAGNRSNRISRLHRRRSHSTISTLTIATPLRLVLLTPAMLPDRPSTEHSAMTASDQRPNPATAPLLVLSLQRVESNFQNLCVGC